MNKVLSRSVTIDGEEAKLVYEYGERYFNLYIEDYLTLIHIDTSIDNVYNPENLYDNVLSDIIAYKIEILKYTLFEKSYYDFLVKDSIEWSDYPRSVSLSLAIFRLIGRRQLCGYLRLTETNS